MNEMYVATVMIAECVVLAIVWFMYRAYFNRLDRGKK